MSEPTVRCDLTFAEIEFLTATSANHDAVATLLHLPDAHRETVSDAGLASLQVRRLAQLRGEAVELSPEVRAVAGLFDRCSDWLDLVSVHDGEPVSLFVGSSDDRAAGLLVTAVAPGCFTCVALDPDLPPAERVSSVAISFVAAEGDNAMYVQRRGDETNRVVVAHNRAGEWLAASADDTLQLTTRDDARQLVETTSALLLATT